MKKYWEKTGGPKGSWLIVLLSGKLLDKYSFKMDYLLIFKTRIQTCCMSSPQMLGIFDSSHFLPLCLRVWAVHRLKCACEYTLLNTFNARLKIQGLRVHYSLCAQLRFFPSSPCVICTMKARSCHIQQKLKTNKQKTCYVYIMRVTCRKRKWINKYELPAKGNCYPLHLS